MPKDQAVARRKTRGKSGQQSVGCLPKDKAFAAMRMTVRATVTNRGKARVKRAILPAATAEFTTMDTLLFLVR
jgi:hypothetical protein